MSRIALVRANALLPCLAFLEGVGAPVERLLGEAGLSAAATGDGERLLPLHACLNFLERAADRERLSELGLMIGRRTSFEQLGAFARLIRQGPTLGEALRVLIAALSLHSSGEVIWLEQRGAQALICHRFADVGRAAPAAGWVQGEMLSACFMLEAVRAALGAAWTPDEVRLPAAAAPWQRDCEAVLQIPVACRGDAAAVVFRASLLAAPNRACVVWAGEVRAGEAWAGEVRAGEVWAGEVRAGEVWAGEPAEYAHLRRTSPLTDFAGALKQVVAASLADGHPDIGRTAHAVGLSVRTLQRRLAQAGVTYSDLVNAARYETCVRMMQEAGVRLTDIASEIGYADQANFTRAFRRWTGRPPRAFRRDTA